MSGTAAVCGMVANAEQCKISGVVQVHGSVRHKWMRGSTIAIKNW